jgi:hypothetical protein
MNNSPPQVGDVMIPISLHNQLVSGCAAYTHAICVSVEPFVMVSQEGDMMWTQQKVQDFRSHGPASDEECALAFDCFHKRGRWAPPPASNELREYWTSA